MLRLIDRNICIPYGEKNNILCAFDLWNVSISDDNFPTITDEIERPIKTDVWFRAIQCRVNYKFGLEDFVPFGARYFVPFGARYFIGFCSNWGDVFYRILFHLGEEFYRILFHLGRGISFHLSWGIFQPLAFWMWMYPCMYEHWRSEPFKNRIHLMKKKI